MHSSAKHIDKHQTKYHAIIEVFAVKEENFTLYTCIISGSNYTCVEVKLVLYFYTSTGIFAVGYWTEFSVAESITVTVLGYRAEEVENRISASDRCENLSDWFAPGNTFPICRYSIANGG